VTRDQAARRIAKLRAMANPAGGATPAERRLAAEKASKLEREHGLRTRSKPRRSRSRRRGTGPGPSPTPSFPYMPNVTSTIAQMDWQFNAKTGEHTDNVKVHSYRDMSNWKIEVAL
jgi:hypothetical protein